MNEQTLYEENGRIAAVFWEWRHKVILLSVSTLAGVLAISSWMYERELRGLLWVPFTLGSFIFLLCWRLERRIATVLIGSYRRGRLMERMAMRTDVRWRIAGGAYSSFAVRPEGVMRAGRPPLKNSFARLLRWTYIGLAIFMACAGLFCLIAVML